MNLSRLKELSYISAASGYEDPMIRFMRQEMEKVTPDVTVDRLGNVIARLPGTSHDPGKPIMVFAHMDELGFVVRKIDTDGFLRLERLGGIPERTAPARPVIVSTAQGPIQGLIGHKAHHFTKPEEKYTVIRIQDLYLDLGVRSRQEALTLGIAVGDPVTYAPFFHVQGDTVMAKSLDNRGGCEILLETLEQLVQMPRHREIDFVASVQEEFSLRGVLPVFQQIKPEVAIAIDVVVSCDTPDMVGVSDTRLGGGPVISRYSFHGRGTLAGVIPNPKLVGLVRATASNKGISTQLNVSMGLLTDASFLQYQGEGVHCLDIGFPARYTHAPVETASLQDMDAVVVLLSQFLSQLPSQADLQRG
jgi:putative aminopeptidase FrvX